MDKVAVVGAGLIGRAWAMVFARAGLAVSLPPEKLSAYTITLWVRLEEPPALAVGQRASIPLFALLATGDKLGGAPPAPTPAT
jgi:hypothetical protein